MHFVLPVPSPLLFAVVAAHGAVDLARDPRPYAVLLLPPAPTLTTALFCFSSIVHFGCDVGFLRSVFGHVLITILALFDTVSAATLLFAYMFLVHMPLLLKRILLQRRGNELLIWIAVCLFILANPHFLVSPTDGMVTLTHRMQGAIVCHTWVEMRDREVKQGSCSG